MAPLSIRREIPMRVTAQLRALCVLAAIVVGAVPSGVLGREMSEQDKIAIAKTLSGLLPAIDVTYTGSPIILGDQDPLVYRLAPSGKPSYGKLFGLGRYDIIHRPDDTFNLGTYLCHLGQEFARARRAQNARFLVPKLELGGSVEYKSFKFEIKGNEETIGSLIDGILYLWDEATNADYGRFEILIRGYADEGQGFVGTMLDDHPINRIVFLPKKDPDPAMLFYLRTPQMKAMGRQYRNVDLPNLRASYVKEIVDAFLTSCRVKASLTSQSRVLDGAVINEPNTAYRSIEIYFYAYH